MTNEPQRHVWWPLTPRHILGLYHHLVTSPGLQEEPLKNIEFQRPRRPSHTTDSLTDLKEPHSGECLVTHRNPWIPNLQPHFFHLQTEHEDWVICQGLPGLTFCNSVSCYFKCSAQKRPPVFQLQMSTLRMAWSKLGPLPWRHPTRAKHSTSINLPGQHLLFCPPKRPSLLYR